MTINTTLNVAILQADLVWENAKANRQAFGEKINSLSSTIDMIVLPEMFTTGFTMNAKNVAETMQGETIQWMQKIASKKNVAITGSIVISDDNRFYNRLLFVHPSGKINYYNKRHTFTLVGEHKVYTSGTKQVIVTYKGWKICPLICYDLRFPVWSRNTKDYDVLLYVANWPKQRITAWNTLLQARAIENMSYVIGVNRIGKDANNNEYSGNSTIVDCLGAVIKQSNENKNSVSIAILEKKHLIKNREKLGFLKDKDTFFID